MLCCVALCFGVIWFMLNVWQRCVNANNACCCRLSLAAGHRACPLQFAALSTEVRNVNGSFSCCCSLLPYRIQRRFIVNAIKFNIWKKKIVEILYFMNRNLYILLTKNSHTGIELILTTPLRLLKLCSLPCALLCEWWSSRAPVSFYFGYNFS